MKTNKKSIILQLQHHPSTAAFEIKGGLFSRFLVPARSATSRAYRKERAIQRLVKQVTANTDEKLLKIALRKLKTAGGDARVVLAGIHGDIPAYISRLLEDLLSLTSRLQSEVAMPESVTLKEGGLLNTSIEHIGAASGKVIYPEIFSCVTVTAVLEDGNLIGAHLPRTWRSEQYDNTFAEMRIRARNTPISSIYVVGNFAKWKPNFATARYGINNDGLKNSVSLNLGSPRTTIRYFDTSKVGAVTDVEISTQGSTISTFEVRTANDHLTRIVSIDDMTESPKGIVDPESETIV